MALIFFFLFDLEDESEELVFVLKCLTVSIITLILGLTFKSCKIIH